MIWFGRGQEMVEKEAVVDVLYEPSFVEFGVLFSAVGRFINLLKMCRSVAVKMTFAVAIKRGLVVCSCIFKHAVGRMN